MTKKSLRVIFDTNILISFLIGKNLSNLRDLIADSRIIVIITSQLLTELELVTSREKLKKYFPKDKVTELIDLLKKIGENVEIKPLNKINRDPKDNFLLDLIEFSNADYLITGDKDLLELNPFKTAIIIRPTEFENILNKQT